MKTYFKYATLLLIIFFAFPGCTSLTMGNKDPKVIIQKNIDSLMTAKINAEWDKVYDFFDSNFKKVTKKESFAHPNKDIFKSYHIEYIKVDPSGMQADALVKADMNVRSFDLKDVPEKQHWIIEKGKWVIVVKPGSNFID